jgi:nicotinamidase-related amidase
MSVANVLIVVDVQNCLMDSGDLQKTQNLVSEIADLVETIPFDYYVVTRDAHPANHTSYMASEKPDTVIVNHRNGRRNSISSQAAFLGSPAMSSPNIEPVIPLGGPWPPHCKMTTDEFSNITRCMPRKNIGEVNTSQNKQANSDIQPTQPSKFYKQHYERAPILKYFHKPDMKLHLLDDDGQQFKEPTDTKFQLSVTNIPGSKDARGPVLQVVKGQLCNWDAYSAFQYHADLRRGKFVNDVQGNLNNTTGLAEVLFSKELGITHFKPGTTKVNIVVCGLMGEVAVKYTVSYGLNTLLNAKMHGGLTGYDRIQGYLITPADIPNVNFIYSGFATRFIPYPMIIAGNFGIRNEIKARISEAGGTTNTKNSGNGISYEILLPPEAELLDKIDSIGAVIGSKIKSVTDAIGLTKSGGKKTRKTKRRNSRRNSRN